mmetsp:Transcript_56193/g.122321  ORF Transcript_56193/g.122321 Transcript_56193/m.122321 type:complete len:335 (+) Transcript_56193:1171-2175(+)|eukprot:1419492-Pleurochrysis_carterae.AAC.2
MLIDKLHPPLRARKQLADPIGMRARPIAPLRLHQPRERAVKRMQPSLFTAQGVDVADYTVVTRPAAAADAAAAAAATVAQTLLGPSWRQRGRKQSDCQRQLRELSVWWPQVDPKRLCRQPDCHRAHQAQGRAPHPARAHAAARVPLQLISHVVAKFNASTTTIAAATTIAATITIATANLGAFTMLISFTMCVRLRRRLTFDVASDNSTSCLLVRTLEDAGVVAINEPLVRFGQRCISRSCEHDLLMVVFARSLVGIRIHETLYSANLEAVAWRHRQEHLQLLPDTAEAMAWHYIVRDLRIVKHAPRDEMKLPRREAVASNAAWLPVLRWRERG